MKASLSLKFLSLQISLAAALPRPLPQGPEDAIAFTSGSLIYESIESTTTPVTVAASESVCTTPRTSTVTGTTTIYQTIEPASASAPAEPPSSSILVAQATPSTNQISLKTTLTTSEVQTFTSATTMMSSNTGVSLCFPCHCRSRELVRYFGRILEGRACHVGNYRTFARSKIKAATLTSSETASEPVHTRPFVPKLYLQKPSRHYTGKTIVASLVAWNCIRTGDAISTKAI